MLDHQRWQQIDTFRGWLDPLAAQAMYGLTVGRGQPTVVVEIGTFCGKSAAVFGLAVERHGGRVYTIDSYVGVGNHVTTLEEVEANLASVGVLKSVMVIKGDSVALADAWTLPFDVLYIDGAHDYESVRADFDAWVPFLVPGGLLLMDDYAEEGPNRVIRERVLGQPGWFDIAWRSITLDPVKRNWIPRLFQAVKR